MMNLKKAIQKVKTYVIGITMHRGNNSVLDEVKKSIVQVREPGEQPRADFLTFDSYVCDLCKDSVKRSQLVQCGFCGRWVCKDSCWNAEYYACLACSGIIKLSKETRGENSRSAKK